MEPEKRMHHPFGHNMVREAAKRLAADDIGDPMLKIRKHFAGDQPAFAHLDPLVNDPFRILFDLFKRSGAIEVTARSQDLVLRFDLVEQELVDQSPAEPALFVEAIFLMVIKGVLRAIEAELQDPPYAR